MQSKSGTKSNKLDSGAPSHLSTCEFASTFRVQTPAPVLIQLYSGPPLTKSAKRHQVGKKNKTDSQMSQSKELWWKQLKRHNDQSCAQGFCSMKEQRIEKSLCSIFNRPETNYLCTGHKFGEVLQEITSPNLWAPSCEVYTGNLYVWRLAVLSASGPWDTTKKVVIFWGEIMHSLI